MDRVVANALDELAEHGRSLASKWHFDWPAPIQQTVHRLRIEQIGNDLPTIAAIVGGASSGKSTVFNNLLDGHLTSRITARGHTTIGPILAVHEDHRPQLRLLLDEGLLLPGYRQMPVELDDNVTGDSGTFAILHHDIDSLRDVLLFDTPDFTSDAALKEGDVTLSLLPWFDRLIVVIDHERWFDRQSISKLRARSTGFAQDRLVLFNRTQEGTLAAADEMALRRQAERLSAGGSAVLEFRRGRGFRLFPPQTLEAARTFLKAPKQNRTDLLLRQVAESANRVLNQNEERTAHLCALRESLDAAVARVLPTTRDCMTSLMTASERRQLEVVSRVLRIQETTDWLRVQQRRLNHALKRIPVVGSLVALPRGTPSDERGETNDRLVVATSYWEMIIERQNHEVQRVVQTSAFWNEIRRWTEREPANQKPDCFATPHKGFHEAVNAFDKALELWTARVETECQGINPHFRGAVGVGTIALAIVLIAAPGPVTALTLISAKTAIGAALGQIVTAAGAGALLGKHVERLAATVQEKLLGSPQFDAVQAAATGIRDRLELAAHQLMDDALAEAATLILAPDAPLTRALEALRNPPEES